GAPRSGPFPTTSGGAGGPRDPGGEQRQPAQVEPLAELRLRLRQQPLRNEHRRHSDRQVDEEDPAPAPPVDDQPAEARAQDGTSSIGTPKRLITRPIRCGPATCARIVWPTGRISPAPRPCRMRKPIKEPIDQATPASREPVMKRRSEQSQTRLAPKRSVAQPLSGMTLAKASM